jgi:hypothetical protein
VRPVWVEAKSGGSAKAAAGGRARKLLDDGIAALATRNSEQATKSIEDSYRSKPSAEALFYLGALALAEGRTLDAQDLMRRFVADPRLSISAETPEAQEAQRILSQPEPPHGQLNIQGVEGTLVRIDGRLRGSLPLSRPLLVTPGSHQIGLEVGSKKIAENVTVPASRFLELRHSPLSGAVVVLELPSVLLLDSYRDLAEMAPQSTKVLSTQLQSENYSLVPLAEIKTSIRDPKLLECLEQEACQARIGELAGVDHVLWLRAEKQGADTLFKLRVIDPHVGEVAATSESRCAACSPAQAASALGKAVQPLLLSAKNRPRGTVRIESTPSGAEVKLGERRLGVTPLTHRLWSGAVELSVQLSGYQSEHRQLSVPTDQTTVLQLALSPLPSIVPTEREPPKSIPRSEAQRRLLWRRVAGGAAIGVGGLFLGFGLSGLYMSRQCGGPLPTPDSVCPDGYHTVLPGATLTALGGAFLLSGVGLIVIPMQRPTTLEKPDAKSTAALGPTGVRM